MSLLASTPKRDKKNSPIEVDDDVKVVEIKKEKVVVELVEEDKPNIAYEIVDETVEEEEEEEEDTTEEEEEEAVEEEDTTEEAHADEEEEEEEEEDTTEEAHADEEEEEEDTTEEAGGVRGDEFPADEESGGVRDITEGETAEDEEVYEVTINGKSYYTTNETSGAIYGLDENGDVSLEVGVYKAGKPTFF
jgi:hypothetical protein